MSISFWILDICNLLYCILLLSRFFFLIYNPVNPNIISQSKNLVDQFLFLSFPFILLIAGVKVSMDHTKEHSQLEKLPWPVVSRIYGPPPKRTRNRARTKTQTQKHPVRGIILTIERSHNRIRNRTRDLLISRQRRPHWAKRPTFVGQNYYEQNSNQSFDNYETWRSFVHFIKQCDCILSLAIKVLKSSIQ